ncbi:CopG family antitoxin [soil metagenome]
MKKRKHDIFDVKLDDYEQEISDSIDQILDKGALKSVANVAEELAFAKEAATNFLRKDERVTLRLSSGDLVRLKQKAAYKGLPYQTFIASVLHEYAAGHFIEVA